MKHRQLLRPARQFLPFCVVCCTAFASFLAFAGANDSADNAGSQSKSVTGRTGNLQPLNALIGQWRGTGQPKRGSRRGAWQETTVCRWDFSGDNPVVLLEAKKGRQFQELRLAISTSEKRLQLTQRISEQENRVYEGQMPDVWPAKLQLETAAEDDGSSYRCTIEQLSDIRLVVLFERRATATGSYRRVAGIGYTRSGHKLAESSGNQRECIVTGGKGTIAVKHKGKTWYVCCEGCRQAFEDSPDEIIADYLARNDG
jgi:YHS domain-containing protein